MIGLTQNLIVAHNLATGNALPVGRENLFRNGVNTPQPYVAFLCASYLCGYLPSIHYGGLFGQLNRWLATISQYSHTHSNRRQSREKLDRWITSLRNGVTA